MSFPRNLEKQMEIKPQSTGQKDYYGSCLSVDKINHKIKLESSLYSRLKLNGSWLYLATTTSVFFFSISFCYPARIINDLSLYQQYERQLFLLRHSISWCELSPQWPCNAEEDTGLGAVHWELVRTWWGTEGWCCKGSVGWRRRSL